MYKGFYLKNVLIKKRLRFNFSPKFNPRSILFKLCVRDWVNKQTNYVPSFKFFLSISIFFSRKSRYESLTKGNEWPQTVVSKVYILTNRCFGSSNGVTSISVSQSHSNICRCNFLSTLQYHSGGGSLDSTTLRQRNIPMANWVSCHRPLEKKSEPYSSR